MRNKMKNLLQRFKSSDEGATLVEYGIALSIAVAVGAGAFTILGGSVKGNMQNADKAITGKETTAIN